MSHSCFVVELRARSRSCRHPRWRRCRRRSRQCYKPTSTPAFPSVFRLRARQRPRQNQHAARTRLPPTLYVAIVVAAILSFVDNSALVNCYSGPSLQRGGRVVARQRALAVAVAARRAAVAINLTPRAARRAVVDCGSALALPVFARALRSRSLALFVWYICFIAAFLRRCSGVWSQRHTVVESRRCTPMGPRLRYIVAPFSRWFVSARYLRNLVVGSPRPALA